MFFFAADQHIFSTRLMVGLASISLLVACQQESQTEPKTQVVKPAAAQPKTSPVVVPSTPAPKKTAASTALFGGGSETGSASLTRQGDTFMVRLPDAKKGAGAVLKIDAKLGYKVNDSYPHHADFKVGNQVIETQVEKTKHYLVFKPTKGATGIDISQLGTSVDLSFSICNDNMCKLYNETYKW